MAVLDNPRHERFAQNLTAGMSASEAYEQAGFNPSRSAASRLSTNVNVVARVAELQSGAAEKTEISVASLTEELLLIAKEARALKEAPGLAVARAALMDIAKLNGLVIDRSENVNRNYAVSGDLPTAESWAAEHVTAH